MRTMAVAASTMPVADATKTTMGNNMRVADEKAYPRYSILYRVEHEDSAESVGARAEGRSCGYEST